MKSWRVKFRNFLSDYFLGALHHTHDGFWYFFRCYKKGNTSSWHTSNFESANKKPSFIRVSAFFSDVIFCVYHTYKENTIKLLLYHSFYGGRIPQENLSPLSWQLASKKYKGSPFSSIPLKKFKLHLSWSLQHSTLNKCGYYFFFAEYKLITC